MSGAVPQLTTRLHGVVRNEAHTHLDIYFS
jgi:hypothetical protein